MSEYKYDRMNAEVLELRRQIDELEVRSTRNQMQALVFVMLSFGVGVGVGGILSALLSRNL